MLRSFFGVVVDPFKEIPAVDMSCRHSTPPCGTLAPSAPPAMLHQRCSMNAKVPCAIGRQFLGHTGRVTVSAVPVHCAEGATLAAPATAKPRDNLRQSCCRCCGKRATVSS